MPSCQMSGRMPNFDDGAARPEPHAGDIAALLHWWSLSGADTLTSDTPASWLELQDAGPAAPALQPVQKPATARPLVAHAASGDAPFADAPTLDALHAMVRARNPGTPLADGNPASGILIMGEAPSAEDLRSGRPFTGPAGVFLDRMLAAIGLDRSGCYITLLAPRRRVPGPPPPDAIAADLPLARAHVRLAAPRHILLLGAAASQSMTGNTTPIGKLRGSWLDVDTGAGVVPALATFNPAYLLRRPEDKALAWADLLAFRKRVLQ